jgi:hypothetical protein
VSHIHKCRMVDGMPAPFFLAYRISHMYGGALEGSTQNYEHLIDADTDANVLRERVNKHFALPSVIDSERGRVHFIAPFSMSSTSQTRYGGGAYSDVRIVIKPAPALRVIECTKCRGSGHLPNYGGRCPQCEGGGIV